MCSRASGPCTFSTTFPRTSTKRYGSSLSQIVIVTLGSRSTLRYFWRCTSVLIRTCSPSVPTHITWVWGWPSGSRVVIVAKFFARASSSTIGCSSWPFLSSGIRAPPRPDAPPGASAHLSGFTSTHGDRLGHPESDGCRSWLRDQTSLSRGFDDPAGLHLAQDLYPLLHGRVGGEEAPGALLELLDRVRDVEVRGRPVGRLKDLAVAGYLLQGVGQSFRVAGELDGGGVGEVLALAGDRELYQPREDRGQDGEQDGDDEHDDLRLPPALSASAAEPEAAQEEVGDQDRGADEDANEHRVADVEVADVGHLVRDDALQLVPIQLLQKSRGNGDGGVLRVAARGEGVGCAVF